MRAVASPCRSSVERRHSPGAAARREPLNTRGNEMKSRLSVIPCLLFGTLFVTACNGGVQAPATGETFELIQGQDTFAGTGSASLLSKAELATYLSDRQYVRSLARGGRAMRINHADPRQHRFAVTRMKMAGKTPTNSPQLFKMLQNMQAADIAHGLAPDAMSLFNHDDGTLQSQHEILNTGRTATPGVVSSTALASRTDPLSYGYVDCTVHDSLGNPLGDTSYLEVYGNMPFLSPTCYGDMSSAWVQSIESDSLLIEIGYSRDTSPNFVADGGPTESYIVGPVVALDALPFLNTPIVNHPVDLNGDGAIVVCLDRTWTGDCEYNNTGSGTLKLPLKGSIAISNAEFDFAKIADYQQGADSNSHIFVTLASTTGGGCSLPISDQTFSMRDFWLRVSGAGNQLSWDLFTDPLKWAQFSSSCRLVQDRVDLTMNLQLPFRTSSFTGNLPVTITTTGTTATPPDFHITPAIRVTNSCLAAGTLVATGDGQSQKIEEIHIGDKVVNPYATSLTVTDTSVGTERAPMVHIADETGR